MSPGTSEFHQVKLPTLHSTRMLNVLFFFFFKSDFRTSVMHVHCVFPIRGQDRLMFSNIEEKI